jgi:hypothetical protein
MDSPLMLKEGKYGGRLREKIEKRDLDREMHNPLFSAHLRMLGKVFINLNSAYFPSNAFI